MNYKIRSLQQLSEHVEEIQERVPVQEIYQKIRSRFESYIETQNYALILRVYNQKGMLPQSRVCQYCGISSKENYIEFILSLLKENKDDAKVIRKAIKHSLGVDKK